jgi:hypothetical protein
MFMKAKDIELGMFSCPRGYNCTTLFVDIKHEGIGFFF